MEPSAAPELSHRCEAPSVAGSGRVFEAGFSSCAATFRCIGTSDLGRDLSSWWRGPFRSRRRVQSSRCAGFNSAAGSTAGRQCWLQGSSRNSEPVRLGRDWLIATSTIVRHPSGGSVNSKAPSPASAKKMSSATGGRAPLLSREEGSSLAVGTTPGEARPTGRRGGRPTITHERGASW